LTILVTPSIIFVHLDRILQLQSADISTNCFKSIPRNYKSWRLSCKRCRLENLVSLCTIFLKNEVQINENNHGTMFLISKQVSVPKISLILPAKNENWPINWYTPFLHKGLNIFIVTCICKVLPNFIRISWISDQWKSISLRQMNFPSVIQAFQNYLTTDASHQLAWNHTQLLPGTSHLHNMYSFCIPKSTILSISNFVFHITSIKIFKLLCM